MSSSDLRTVGAFGRQTVAAGNFWTNLDVDGVVGRQAASEGGTLGDYCRFGSRLIDMTQQHSGIPTLMTTSTFDTCVNHHQQYLTIITPAKVKRKQSNYFPPLHTTMPINIGMHRNISEMDLFFTSLYVWISL